jgi:hypothetical protein
MGARTAPIIAAAKYAIMNSGKFASWMAMTSPLRRPSAVKARARRSERRKASR